MTSDLDDIQWLWGTLVRNGWNGNLVLFLQKELSEDVRGKHFFFGKMHLVELKPFSPTELLRAYLEIHNSIYPFDGEAIFVTV